MAPKMVGTVGDDGMPVTSPLDKFPGGEHSHATFRHSGYGPHGGLHTHPRKGYEYAPCHEVGHGEGCWTRRAR